jgi:hypothetical protein
VSSEALDPAGRHAAVSSGALDPAGRHAAVSSGALDALADRLAARLKVAGFLFQDMKLVATAVPAALPQIGGRAHHRYTRVA